MLELLIFVKWLVICVIATEAATEIIVESKLFQPFHTWVRGIAYPEDAPPPDTRKRKFFVFLDALTSCGYCLSVWVGHWFAVLLPGYPGFPIGPAASSFGYIRSWVYTLLVTYLFWQAYGMLVHRLSNVWHDTYMIWKRGRVRTHDLTVRIEENTNG